MPTNGKVTEPPDRRFYKDLRNLSQRICNQDGCITWLLVELRALQKRVDKLEQHNAHTAANMVRAASERAEEIWDDIKQRDESNTSP